jgi:hypothetical protein
VKIGSNWTEFPEESLWLKGCRFTVMQIFTVAFILYVLQYTCTCDEKRLRNITYLLLNFLMVTMDPLNGVSHNIAVCKNISTTLNKDLLYLFQLIQIILRFKCQAVSFVEAFI